MNKELNTWHFGVDNDRLISLVLNGKKTATTSIYTGTIDKEGTESILIYDNEKQACITRTLKNIICQFKDINWEIAKMEGEYNTLEEWKEKHITYFKTIKKEFNENTKVVVEIFEVAKNLQEERLKLGRIIALNNNDIIPSIQTINEINAGFNNHLFNINNKYILKICGNKKDEKLFEIEKNFYYENKNNKNLPKLFKYDNSKTIVPYVYEIIENIKGKSIYYYWYKWNEKEREAFIKELIDIIKNIHIKKIKEDTWKNDIKNEILLNYNKCINLFTRKDKEILKKVIELIDTILSDNHYSQIHNDLHFDNIILDENNNIKLIDFNDSIIAPFDYDMRILFMCQSRPWKWANTEMDPYQKEKDYKNIINYIKKYYIELTKIKYLDERMIVYEILNDIRHLPKYKSEELVKNIINNSMKILNAFEK